MARIALRRLLPALVTAMTLVAGFAGACGTAVAQSAPKSTKIVVAFPPGGPVDIVARLLNEPLAKGLGYPVIVENKAGGNTLIAAEMVARSPADGSVMFLATMSTMVMNPLLYASLPYDWEKDFAPVSLVVQSPTVLVVHPSNAAKDAPGFVAASKASAQPIPVGSAGAGGTTHIALEVFADVTGARVLHVPYKGAAPVISDLVNNQIGAFFGDLPGVIGHIKGGKLKPLAVLSPKGHPLLPGVKTLVEQGISAESGNWYALFVPAKTPPDLIAKINTVLTAALTEPAMRDRFIAIGAEPIPSKPEDVTAAIRREVARLGPLLKAKGIKIE